MKKFIFLLSISIGLLVTTQAQIAHVQAGAINQGGLEVDTLTASAVLTYDVFIPFGVKFDYSVQSFTDSLSGTPAYVCLLQGSNNYINLVTLNADTTSGGNDTMIYVEKTGNKWKYLRRKFTATAAAQKSKVFNYWNFVK